MEISTAVFYLVAIITVGSAAMVAFSRNIIYSAFSLLGAFGGVAGIYVFLGADFVAAAASRWQDWQSKEAVVPSWQAKQDVPFPWRSIVMSAFLRVGKRAAWQLLHA